MSSDISDSIIVRCPHLLDDDEIRPLIERMSNVERLLKAHISKKRLKSKKSTYDADTAYTRFADELDTISNQILTIVRDRSMYESIARIERGKKLLGIRTN